MNCREVLQEISLILDGELSPERCEELKGHLERCTECFGRHETERLFKELVRRRCGCESAPAQPVPRISFAIRLEVAGSE